MYVGENQYIMCPMLFPCKRRGNKHCTCCLGDIIYWKLKPDILVDLLLLVCDFRQHISILQACVQNATSRNEKIPGQSNAIKLSVRYLNSFFFVPIKSNWLFFSLSWLMQWNKPYQQPTGVLSSASNRKQRTAVEKWKSLQAVFSQTCLVWHNLFISFQYILFINRWITF